ncbi:MAG: SusC/RagA family TonB-linked outer membrane protein, partial [Rikenellaceae bacterium]|nr:SusC/RagA family TonB-linked outer membrane protein [Rikenellaceae bacterium]
MKCKLDLTKGFALFIICFLSGGSLWAQSKTVQGTVTDAAGPVVGASVTVQGTTTGVTTTANGTYSIRVPNNDAVLEFNFVGYETISMPVGDKTTIDVVMNEDAQLIDDVVVIGYQTIRRKDLTGSVASVAGKEIATAPVSNVAMALQGKLAGVNVTSQDGRPDAKISIRVRGGGSISQSNEPLILIDGVAVNSLTDIPSAQIESIDVLKDASSTAIYGARGANGVILVTTKGAKQGDVTVSYNGYAKFNTPTKYLDAMDPYDYIRYVWANAAANGDAYKTSVERLFGLGAYQGSTGNAGGIESYRNTPRHDMQKDIYNGSFSHNQDISVAGGTDKTSVRFSLNYMDEEGMKVNSYSKRANMSLKVSQQLFKNVDLSLDTRYVNMNDMGNEGTSSGAGSILSYAYRFRPIATSDIKGDVGALRGTNIESYAKNSMWDTFSPAARASDYYPQRVRDNIVGTLSLNWKMIEGLTYHTDLTLSKTWNNNKTWSGAVYNDYLDALGNKLYAGNADYDKRSEWALRWTNTLNYDRTFGEIHRVGVMAGQEVTDSGGEGLRIRANYFPSNFSKKNAFAMINQYDTLDGKNSASISSSSSIPNRIISLFGRANYTFKDRYLFTFTFRADGSSKFAPSNRWGYFPAGALAWRVSEEPFMAAAQNWLDNLKL